MAEPTRWAGSVALGQPVRSLMLFELRMRALLASLATHVAPEVLEPTHALLDTDEPRLAFEILCKSLDENEIALLLGEVVEIESLGREMGSSCRAWRHTRARETLPVATAALLVLADSDSLAGRTEQALATADAAVAQEPNSGWPYFVRATVRSRAVTGWALLLGNNNAKVEMASALADIERSIELDPTTSVFHVLRGEILSRLRDHPAARAEFAMALQLDPNNELAMAELAEIDIREVRLGAAADDVAAGLAINPQSASLQKRSHQFLRLRVFLPLWVATLTPSLAFLTGLWLGHRSAITFAVVLIGTVASAAFAWRWWRHQLTTSDRSRFLRGDGRRVFVIGGLLWLLLTLGGLVFLFQVPTVELWNPSRPRAPSSRPSMRGVDLVGMLTLALTGAGVVGVMVLWLYSRVVRRLTHSDGGSVAQSTRRHSNGGPEQSGGGSNADDIGPEPARRRAPLAPAMITRKLGPVTEPTALSSDVVVSLEPPWEIVIRLGGSTMRFDAVDTCNSPWVLVGERAGLVVILGWEATTVLVADPLGRRVNVAGHLDRLDLSNAYDPGGMLNPAFHAIPDSIDILVEYEVGLARLDLVERRLTWQHVYDHVSERVDGISDGAVWISGADTSYALQLADGSFAVRR